MRGPAVKDGKRARKPGPVRTKKVLDAFGEIRDVPSLSELQLVIGYVKKPFLMLNARRAIPCLEQQGIGFVWKEKIHWCGTFSLCHLGDGEAILTQMATRLSHIEYGQGMTEKEKPMRMRKISRALVAVWKKDEGLDAFLAPARKVNDEAILLATVAEVLDS